MLVGRCAATANLVTHHRPQSSGSSSARCCRRCLPRPVDDPCHRTKWLCRMPRVKLRAGRTRSSRGPTRMRHWPRSGTRRGLHAVVSGAELSGNRPGRRQPFVDDRAGGQRRPAEFGPVAGPPAPGTAVGARCFVRVCWTGVPLVVTGEPGGRDRPASAAERCPLTQVTGRYPTPRTTRKGALIIYGSPRDALNGKVIEGAGPAALL